MNSSFVNEESIVTCAPEFKNKSTTASSTLPKPFENLVHLRVRDPLLSSVRSESPQSPALVSPHNRAWLDSPDSFIGRIPESSFLADCIAFVDVWSTEGNDNRSIVFARILSRMGATIARRFTKHEKITHLIFKDGHKSYLQKAKKRNIKIVNCLWVDKCRLTQTWVNEEPYYFDDSNYIPPKKFREMQPLDPEQELVRSEERAKRRQRREEIKNAKKAVAFLSPLVTNDNKNKANCERKKTNTLVNDTPYRPVTHSFYQPRLVSETPSESILRKLQRMKEGKPIFSPPSSPLSDSSQNSAIIAAVKADATVPPTVTGVSSGVASIIPSSQHSSDMDLTCVEQGQRGPPDIENIAWNESERNEISSSKRNSANSETSGICLHISGSSNSFSDDSTVLNVDIGKRNTPPLQITATFSKPIEKPKRARRKLCEDDVLNPASILPSPNRSNNLPPEQTLPRRSRRLSSITASQAISMMYKPRHLSQSSDDSVLTQDSTLSTLPPPGLSATRYTTRRRFFEPIRTSTSVCEETCDTSDDNRTSKSCQSVSTAYEDNMKNDVEYDFDEGEHTPLVLSSSRTSNAPTPRSRKQPCPYVSSSDKENEPTLSNKSGRKKKRRSLAKTKQSFDKETILQDITDAPKPRRSTDEFKTAPLSDTLITQTQRRKRKTKKNSVLVLTSLHSQERVAMEKIVRRLGRFRVRSSVKDKHASHVVCGAARRTLNVLHAITRGLWLLSKDWLLDSMRAGKWLNEEDYEVNYFPVAKQARILRDENPNWTLSLFRPVKGHVYVSPNTEPPSDELRELVTQCGGHVIGSPRRALIRVGRWVTVQYSLPAVKETWILGKTALQATVSRFQTRDNQTYDYQPKTLFRNRLQSSIPRQYTTTKVDSETYAKSSKQDSITENDLKPTEAYMIT